jgi:hypothetical protein
MFDEIEQLGVAVLLAGLAFGKTHPQLEEVVAANGLAAPGTYKQYGPVGVEYGGAACGGVHHVHLLCRKERDRRREHVFCAT